MDYDGRRQINHTQPFSRAAIRHEIAEIRHLGTARKKARRGGLFVLQLTV
jgi:hypothetical protein